MDGREEAWRLIMRVTCGRLYGARPSEIAWRVWSNGGILERTLLERLGPYDVLGLGRALDTECMKA